MLLRRAPRPSSTCAKRDPLSSSSLDFSDAAVLSTNGAESDGSLTLSFCGAFAAVALASTGAKKPLRRRAGA